MTDIPFDESALFWVAAAASAVTFVVHTFIGGPRVAVPLLANQSLPKASKWLNYYCWHIATTLLFAMTVAFALVAAGIADPDLAAFLGALAMLLTFLSVGVAMKGGIHPLRFPSTSLFASIAIVTLAAFCL